MYGTSFETIKLRLDNYTVEQLKEIKLNPDTADVDAEHNNSWVGESKEQLVMDE